MSYSIAQVEADLEATLHGSTLNEITNLFGLFNRAARVLLADCDPNETMRFTTPAPLYTGVYSYTAPSDLKGNRIFDIRPQVNRQNLLDAFQTDEKTFDRAKADLLSGAMSTTVWNTGVKSLEIAVNQLPVLQVNDCGSLTGNGTWNGNVTNLAADNLNYVQSPGSIKFSATNGQYIQNSTMAAVDLTTVKPEGVLFFWLWFDSAPTSFNTAPQIGSSASDLWVGSAATANFDGTAFHQGWNLIGIPWSSMTVASGTPNIAAVKYFKLAFTNPPSGVMRLDTITSSLGAMFDIGYYSKFLFRDGATGAFKETVTDTSDLVNLDTDSYQLFFSQCMILAAQQIQGLDANFADLPFYQNAYNEGIQKYQAKYPSQALKTQTPYYVMRQGGYAKFLGRRTSI